MLFFVKRVFEEYKTFVVKMNDGLHAIEATRSNFEFLCDVEVVMGLIYIMPMLEVLHGFIKFTQSCYIFVCDFVIAIKMCCGNGKNMV
jgi:hypothetical protein